MSSKNWKKRGLTTDRPPIPAYITNSGEVSIWVDSYHRVVRTVGCRAVFREEDMLALIENAKKTSAARSSNNKSKTDTKLFEENKALKDQVKRLLAEKASNTNSSKESTSSLNGSTIDSTSSKAKKKPTGSPASKTGSKGPNNNSVGSGSGVDSDSGEDLGKAPKVKRPKKAVEGDLVANEEKKTKSRKRMASAS